MQQPDEPEDDRGDFNAKDNPAYEDVIALFDELTAGRYENHDIPARRDLLKDYSTSYSRTGNGTLPGIQVTLSGGKGTYTGGLLNEYDVIAITVSRLPAEGPVPVTGSGNPLIIKMTFMTKKRTGARLVIGVETGDIDYNKSDDATIRHGAELWYRELYNKRFTLAKLLG